MDTTYARTRIKSRLNLVSGDAASKFYFPTYIGPLRTFAQKFSGRLNFFKFLLQADNELLVPEMQKKLGGHRLRFRDKARGKLY